MVTILLFITNGVETRPFSHLYNNTKATVAGVACVSGAVLFPTVCSSFNYMVAENPQLVSSGWGLSLYCLSAKFEDKDVHNRLIEGVGHLLLRYVPFQFVMTQTAEVEDMIVVLSTVVPDGVNVMSGHSRPLTTAGTVPLRSHRKSPWIAVPTEVLERAFMVWAAVFRTSLEGRFFDRRCRQVLLVWQGQ
jgi:hypothetical protein